MIEIRRLTNNDIPFVAEIERLCFDEPWSERSLALLLDEKNAGFVAILDGRVAAYGGMITVLDEGQITNIATHPDFRRLGLARQLMGAIDAFSAERGIAFLSLEVREQNLAARSLYTSCDGVRRGLERAFIQSHVITQLL